MQAEYILTFIRDRKIIVIGKGAFASVVLAKHNGKEVVLKGMVCKHLDEEEKNF